MKKISSFIFLLSCLLIGGASYAQNDPDLIMWSKDAKLQWSDFQDSPSKLSKYAANSACGTKFRLSRSQRDSLEIVIETYFKRSKSWSKSEQQNERLLSHEQGHFDITEWNARKLRKRISKLRISGESDLKAFQEKVNKLYKESYEEFEKESDAYDTETNHSIIEPMQEKWTKKINEGIESLNDYSATRIAVVIPQKR